MSDRLIVFARRPEAGRVKTRLTPPLSPDAAAEVYEACLRDVLALAAAERARIEIWFEEYAGPDAAAGSGRGAAGAGTSPTQPAGDARPGRTAGGSEAYFAREFPVVPLVRQAKGDLGERMADAFDRSFAAGAGRVLLLGSDSPTLPPDTLHAAFDHLLDAEGVLGPALDGGYYLVGLRREAWPAAAGLFREVPWSTPDVLRVTALRAAEAGLALRTLPGWYDIDRPEDLARARVDAPPDSHLARWLAGPEGERYIPRP